jgi:hypothetical protein
MTTTKAIELSQFASTVSVDANNNVEFSGDFAITDKIVHSGDIDTSIRFPAADTVTVETNGAERLRITSTGNVGIGTSSPTTLLNMYSGTAAQLLISGDAATNIIGARYSNDANATNFAQRKYRGTLASPAAVQSGDIVGSNIFSAFDGTQLRNLGQFNVFVDTFTGTNDLSSFMTFTTRPAGVGAILTERMRITSTGNVGIGTTSPTATLHVNGTVAGTFLSTQVQAEAGTDNTTVMTPLRTAEAIAARAVPAGTLSMFAGSSPPTGWLVANGSLVSRTTYASLFAAIGTTWGAGDGSTTFALPDARNRYPRGSGSSAVGAYLGQSTQQHGHRTSMGFDGGAFFGWRDGGGLPIFGQELFTAQRVVTSGSSATAGLRIAYTEASMINISGETRPESITLLPIIKF